MTTVTAYSNAAGLLQFPAPTNSKGFAAIVIFRGSLNAVEPAAPVTVLGSYRHDATLTTAALLGGPVEGATIDLNAGEALDRPSVVFIIGLNGPIPNALTLGEGFNAFETDLIAPGLPKVDEGSINLRLAAAYRDDITFTAPTGSSVVSQETTPNGEDETEQISAMLVESDSTDESTFTANEGTAGLAFALSVAAINTAFRVRSAHAKNAGSLLESVQVQALKGSFSEAFFSGDGPEVGSLYQFEEYLEPGISSLRYYPKPVDNNDWLDTQRGRDKLDRMEDTYPPPIMAVVSDITGDPAQFVFTGQQVLEHVFSVWASLYDWFSYEPIPDLRVRALSPDRSDDFTLITQVIHIAQKLENRLNMRQIFDEIAEIFSPTLIFQNSSGNIQVVCLNGPDAPNSSTPLTWADIEFGGWSSAVPNEDTIFNGATVISQGYELSQTLQEPTEPAWIAVRHPQFYPADQDEWFDQPVDRSPLTAPLPPGADQIGDEGYTQTQGFVWSLAEDVLPNSTIVFVDPETSNDLITANYRTTAQQSGVLETTILSTLPLDGNTYVVAELKAESAGNENLSAQLEMRYDEEQRAVIVNVINIDNVRTRTTQNLSTSFGTWYAMFEFNLNSLAQVFAKSASKITARFTRLSGAYLPTQGDSESNLIEASAELYGDREKTIYSNFFQLTATQAAQVAQGFVLANIEAKARRTVRQSVRNAYPIKFDHIGSYAAAPNNELVLVEDRDYADDFSSRDWSMSCSFKGVVSLPPFVAVDKCFLTDGLGQIITDGSGSPITVPCVDRIPTGGGDPVSPGAAPVSLSLRGDPTFNNSTKGGAAFTTAQQEAYDAILAFFTNNLEYGAGSTGVPLIGTNGYFTGKNYGAGIEADGKQISRIGQGYIVAAFTPFRLTGDLRLLDEADDLMNAYYPSWKTGWTSPKTSDPVTGPSPYKAVRAFNNQPDQLYGKDLTLLEECRNYALVAQSTYAFDLNRDLTSPGGNNYGASADKWKDILFNHIIPKWRGGGDSGWRAGYKGFQQQQGAGTIRAADNAVPFLQRLELHSLQAKLKGDYYMYLLTGDEAWKTSFDADMAQMLSGEYLDIVTSYGTGKIWRHSPVSFTGDASLGYAHHYFYFPSVIYDLIDLRLEGAFAGIDDEFLEAAARTVADFYIPSAGSTTPDLNGGVSRTTVNNTVIPTGPLTATSDAKKSIYYQAGHIIGWDTPDDHLEDEFTINQNAHGGLATPQAPHVPVGLFLKRTDLTAQGEFWNVPQGSTVTDPAYYDLETGQTYAKTITLNAGVVADPLADPECPADLTAAYANRIVCTTADDPNAVIAAAPNNSLIWFEAGDHLNINQPNFTKPMLFAGAAGAAWKYTGATPTSGTKNLARALYSNGDNKVGFYNLTLQDYDFYDDGSDVPEGVALKIKNGLIWRVHGIDLGNAGIDFGLNCVVRFVRMTRPGRLGFYHNGENSNVGTARREYCYTEESNFGEFVNYAVESGDCKYLFSRGMPARWNQSLNSKSWGGEWYDHKNRDILVEYCTSRGAAYSAYHIELAESGTVRYSTAEGTGGVGGYLHSNSYGVTYDGIYSRDCVNAFWIKDYSRGETDTQGNIYRARDTIVKNGHFYLVKQAGIYNVGNLAGFDSKLTNDLAGQNIVFSNNQYIYDDQAAGANLETDTPFVVGNAPSPIKTNWAGWKAEVGEVGSTLKFKDQS